LVRELRTAPVDRREVTAPVEARDTLVGRGDEARAHVDLVDVEALVLAHREGNTGAFRHLERETDG